jgi:hypothetical protein
MSESFDPNSFAHKLDANHRQWIQSVQSVVNGQIEIGTPEQNSPFATSGVNQGVPTQYKRANGSGVMIRIDAAGVTAGATYNWISNGVGIPIKHALQRVPIGFHVVDQDGVITVYRTVPPTDQLITLAPSDYTKSVTVYVF